MRKNTTEEKTIVKEKIKDMTAPEVLRTNFMPYAMSVIVSRAIPEIDGLKPSHRKILYTMYDMGLLTGIRTKSANIAARTMLLNPHGDQGNYDAMVRLTQHNETLLTPLVDGKGSFGKHYSRDISAAASRYTEAKLLPVAHEFFDSIKKNTVDFVDNYDSTRKEPRLLPVTFPNILANPTEGIAVGLASSIPSFNLAELCNATILRIQRPSDDIRAVMPAPDFTTGAYILMEDAVMEKIYETGRGSIRMRAKYNVDKKNRIIEVYEIPYSTTAEAIIEGIVNLIKSGKIRDINDVRNEISLNGFKIAIDYKRGVDPDELMKKLFHATKLEDSYSCNMTVLIDGHPREIGVVEILDEWIKWRRECVKRELTFDLAKKRHELHLLEGLAKVLADIDKAVRIIRNTEDDSMVVPNLMKGFKIDEEQATYIAEIKLRNLNKDYILNRTASINTLRSEIDVLNKQIGSDSEIAKIIIGQLNTVKKKYGKERRSEIIPYEEAPVVVSQPVVANYPVSIYRTREGYIKKIPATALKNDPEIIVKDSDEIIQKIDTENVSELLFFTNKCVAYKLLTHTLKDSKPTDLGDYISNLIELEPDEEILFMCICDPTKNLLIGYANGRTARIPLKAYETKTNRKKLVGVYNTEYPIVGFHVADDDDMFGYLSSDSKLVLFKAGSIPLKVSKSTKGVYTMKLKGDATAVLLAGIKEFKGADRSKYTPKSLPAMGSLWKKK